MVVIPYRHSEQEYYAVVKSDPENADRNLVANKRRILHVVGAMNRGGVETWLMHVLRHIDRDRFQLDFLVHTDKTAAYDSEIEVLGSRILRCPATSNPIQYATQFLAACRQFGPFDVLHSHVHYFSGYLLALGRLAGIPVRIAHGHTDTSREDASAGRLRKAYAVGARCLIAACCTHGLAVSQDSAALLFGSEWRSDRRFAVLPCAIDLKPFAEAVDPIAVRAEFGFSPHDLVFGHAGRFIAPKNHTFLIETAAEIVRLEPRARFLLAGDGPLREATEKLATDRGLAGRMVFAGLRADVPRLMTAAMDAFLFPSTYEGLPLVMMEAQAAGLPCLVSEAITEEAVIHHALVRRLPLAAGAREWARAAQRIATRPRPDRSLSLEMAAASPFSIAANVEKLASVYAAGDGAAFEPQSTLSAAPSGASHCN